MHWNCCIKAMCSTVACCNSSVLCSSVCADRTGMAASTLLLKGTCSAVLSCKSDCAWLHGKSMLADRIGTDIHQGCDLRRLGFAQDIVFFRVNGASVAEKSRLACATVAAILALPSIPVRFVRAVELKVPGDFFLSLLMLCYCVLHVLRYFVHWNCCMKMIQ